MMCVKISRICTDISNSVLFPHGEYCFEGVLFPLCELVFD